MDILITDSGLRANNGSVRAAHHDASHSPTILAQATDVHTAAISIQTPNAPLTQLGPQDSCRADVVWACCVLWSEWTTRLFFYTMTIRRLPTPEFWGFNIQGDSDD